MNTYTRFAAALPLILGLLTTGCGVAPGAGSAIPPVPLAGTRWALTQLTGQTDTGPAITLNLEDARLGGSDGCNSYGGGYTLNGGKLTVDKNLVSTMMACPEPVMRRATAYTSALVKAASYSSDGKTLTLLDSAGALLAVFARQSEALGGTAWLATGFNNGNQAVVSVGFGAELSAYFGADARMTGSAGCNNYVAGFEAAAGKININSPAGTKKACPEPPGVMAQEAQYLKALESAATYRIDGDRLELRTADGALAATFVRAAPGAAAETPVSPATAVASPWAGLPNAEYPVEGLSTPAVRLKGGVFEEPAAPGSASKNRVELGPERAFGDLDGDGDEDAVVVLAVSRGGSGTFLYLASVINEKGAPKASAAVLLGDRVAVTSLAIGAGTLSVGMLVHKPGEPLSAVPTVSVTRSFKHNGGLVEILR